MTSEPEDPSLQELEEGLRQARGLLDSIEIRDVRAGVRRELETGAGQAPRLVRRHVTWPIGAFAIIAVFVSVGVAAAGLGLPHFFIRSGDVPVPSAGAIGTGWPFGLRVDIDEAQSRTSWPLSWPPSVGAPQRAYVLNIGAAVLVTLTYDPRAGFPAGEGRGPGIMLVELGGNLEAIDVGKTVPDGGLVESVDLGGVPGLWVAGKFHYFQIEAHDEHLLQQIAGQTLVWELNGVVYRIETRAGKDATLALAREMVTSARD